jgi:hypothetical protein
MSRELAIFQIIFFPLALTVAYFLFRNLRDRPTDRPTIEIFAARYGLRILSVARANPLLAVLRLSISPTARQNSITKNTRVYYVVAVDSEGNQGRLCVAFVPLTSQMNLLDVRGLSLVPPMVVGLAEDVVQ